MSVIDLQSAKQFLDVIHNADDAKLQMLLDGAEREALDFMNRKEFGMDECSSETSAELDAMPDSVRLGVLLLLQAAYQATPDDAKKLRIAAEVKLMPYRCFMGV
ncbi:head-tail connector protein [Bordetella genomosp. 9]|uniref:Phage gp6-like head-tail connector protein n=1 Tax=Bordetella genomosp. 9 TaxID=1416803 RepID=A0A1W6Z0C6_9BORD|nr:head-tail connector protein [Bordetella genomosp. 9]ARP86293.1 hypothetical protein CAL13_08845 [Bordetella genomosp. 9]